jgi:hypothetical protein
MDVSTFVPLVTRVQWILNVQCKAVFALGQFIKGILRFCVQGRLRLCLLRPGSYVPVFRARCSHRPNATVTDGGLHDFQRVTECKKKGR